MIDNRSRPTTRQTATALRVTALIPVAALTIDVGIEIGAIAGLLVLAVTGLAMFLWALAAMVDEEGRP